MGLMINALTAMKTLLRCCCLFLLSGSAFALTRAVEAHDVVRISGGMSGLFDTERVPVVILDYRFAKQWNGVHPWLGLSWATDGAIFAGGGAVYTLATSDSAWAFSAGAGPGYYERHQGDDLGSHLEFCTFAEVERRLSGEHRLVLRLVHISNGGLTERNPGAELLMLGYAIPLP